MVKQWQFKSIFPIMNLTTSRLHLRPVSPSDAATILDYRSEESVARFVSFNPQSSEQVKTFIEERIARVVNEPGTWYQFAVIERNSRIMIGDIGVHFLADAKDQVELGITFSSKFQKKGYAQEALRAVIDYCFRDLNKHRIIASIDPRNIPSATLFDRLGFRQEAHFVKSLWWKGEWVDDLIYAVLREEWNLR